MKYVSDRYRAPRAPIRSIYCRPPHPLAGTRRRWVRVAQRHADQAFALTLICCGLLVLFVTLRVALR